MTGSELAIMLTILFWIVQLVDDLPDSFVHDLAAHLTAPTSLGGFLLGLGALLVVWFGLAAAAAILKNFGFTMTRAGHDLRVARGLLDRREGTMPVHRLQAIRIRQTLVRRALRLVEVVLQSAGQATSNGRGVSRIDVPILDEGALAPLLEELLPAAPPDPATYRPAPPAARRRAILRRAVPAAAIAVVVGVVAPRLIPLGVLLVVLAVAAGELAYRGLAHAWERELLVVRAGGLARETVVVPAAKAQSTRLRTSPLQRRAGLATLFVDVAGKGHTPRIRDGDVDRLRHLQAAILLASPAARADEARLRRRETLG
jgi:putative membrane protein